MRKSGSHNSELAKKIINVKAFAKNKPRLNKKEIYMKRNRSFIASRTLRANNQRRTMLKRTHQKIMARRKLFAITRLAEESSDAC